MLVGVAQCDFLVPPTSPVGLSSPDGKDDLTINVKADLVSELYCMLFIDTIGG